MKFHLRVYDNFHFADEFEAYNFGEYETYEDAIIAARAIVEEFFVHHWKRGMTAESLLQGHAQYGEEPIILPSEPGENICFSARTYANEIAETVCKKLQQQSLKTE
jgi:hypothetical protein